MKIGFSSLVCPAWDVDTIIENASALKFDGVELRGLQGQMHLPVVPALAGQPDQVRGRFEKAGVELVCLGASATLDAKSTQRRATQKAEIIEFVELAAKLGCPSVRIFAGEVQKWDNPHAALSRIASAVTELVPTLTRFDVTLLIENGGDFCGSDDIWFLIDSIDHPNVRACWNQCNALTGLEQATTSIPRLGNKMRMVHVCDAKFDEHGILDEYVLPGLGDADVETQVNLLRGLTFDRYLMFEWPKMWVGSLPAPETALPSVAEFLQSQITKEQTILSAYKGDKNAPSFRSRMVAEPKAANSQV